MDLHGGRVSVHSDGEGKGSTFTMDVPLYQYSANDAGNAESMRSSERIDADKCSGGVKRQQISMDTNDNMIGIVPSFEDRVDEGHRHIASIKNIHPSRSVLVVDDAVLTRKMVCRLLMVRYDSIAQASNGLEAFNHVRESMSESGMRKPDVILMDYMMPVMDGPSATRKIRALGYTGQIIGISGNVSLDEREKFLASGANMLLTKPVATADLMSALEGERTYSNQASSLP